MNEPLKPQEYSLAAEARLLRRLIDAADGNPGLQANLTKVLKEVLLQDESRRLRANELVATSAVKRFVDDVFGIINRVLASHIDSDLQELIVDEIGDGIIALQSPVNDKAERQLLLGRRER